MGIQYFSPEEIKDNKEEIRKKLSLESAHNYFIRTGEVIRVAQRYFDKNFKIVDVGAGSGFLTKKMLEAGFKDISMVDIDDYIQYEGCGRLNVVDVCFEKLPYADGSKDVVMAIAIVEHLENPYFFVREVSRILKQGGYVMLAIPHTLSLKSRLKYLFSGNLIGYRLANNHITYFTRDIFSKIFLSKFEIIAQQYSKGYIKFPGNIKLKFGENRVLGRLLGDKTLILMKKI